MSRGWPTVRLGEVLTSVERPAVPEPGTAYRQLGVKLWGVGAYERESMDGAATKYKTLSRVEKDDVVVNKIWARNGSVAVVQPELAGCYVSGEFPTFECQHDRVLVRWIHWLTKRPEFWRQCDLASRGTSGKNRIKPEQFLRVEIPLPHLEEQRRIVARIEKLAGHVASVRALRELAATEAAALVTSLHLQLAGTRSRRLGDIVVLDEDVIPVDRAGSYPQVGVRSFGGGLFPKAAVGGAETTYRTFNRLFAGALVMSQVKAWEGAVAVCPDDLAGWFVSPEYRTFRCVPAESRPEYLASLVRTPWFWGKLLEATRGVGARRERTRPEQFVQVAVSMPDVAAQSCAERVFIERESLRLNQTNMSEALDALLPAFLDRAFRGDL